ncbi:MAG: GAF domain-containing protein [Bacteroidota bacterium]
MMHSVSLPDKTDKKAVYEALLPQLQALCAGENDLVANLGNIAAAIHAATGSHWTGFYLVKNEELVLGPFQGPVACTRIGYGKGVCGTAWKEKKTMLVKDVETFPGHIACSSLSRAEIVVPLLSQNGEVLGVLDLDHTALAAYDETDGIYLQAIARFVSTLF